MKDEKPWLVYHSEAWYKHYCEYFNYANPDQQWRADMNVEANTCKRACDWPDCTRFQCEKYLSNV